MKDHEALRKMYPPGKRRPGKPHGGVLQLWVTRACDKSCYGCTQASNLKGAKEFITPEQFEQACYSLRDYWGTVGVFGGNPCLHPQFDQLCDILATHIPFQQRGLWANKFFGHGPKIRETFNPARSNINAHMDKKAVDEIRKDWPDAKIWCTNTDCRHSPVYLAMQDLIEDEDERWGLIANCDININWSAMICVFRGELRGFFCEVAGSMAMLLQDDPTHPDLGVKIEDGWWQKTMKQFAPQARTYCHMCGVPLRGFGELSQSKDENSREQTTKTWQGVFEKLGMRGGHQFQVVTDLHEIKPQSLKKMTHYVQNAKAKG